MFEKTLPLQHFAGCDEIGTDMRFGGFAGSQTRGGDALRAVEWSELTAKLEAARDLRRVLQRDTRHHIGTSAASFGDAAATYFSAIGEHEQIVNHNALEGCKASDAIMKTPEENAQEGVRETTDD